MPLAYRRAELPSVKGHFGISCLVWALVVQFSFHHTWSSLALVTAILLQRDVPLYVTWHNVSQMCPFIYKWKKFNFFEYYLLSFVCVFCEGGMHMLWHTCGGQRRTWSQFFPSTMWILEMKSNCQSQRQVFMFQVISEAPEFHIFLWDNSIQLYVPRLISYLCHFK